ncbi:MAG: choice-of-anchor L domain-containing protein, partial [Flavobacteriales bacterium]
MLLTKPNVLMTRNLLTCLLLGISFSLSSQITVDNSYTLDEYVNDILLGSGVTAFNVEYTGSLDQLGFLEGAEGTLFPINEGLILSTSTATNLAAEDCIEDNPPFEELVSGNADLLDIANSVPGMINENFSVISVNDLCILEFDFIATGDTVKFNYAFGSDEYIDEFGTDYVNTQYNDIFAFFLSGPGISGPYDNDAINIAQVPGIEPPLPITISSVNQFLNTEFFIGNSTNVDICQNGFTVSIEASHPVTCGETYHIRLAIGDGSDGALESV